MKFIQNHFYKDFCLFILLIFLFSNIISAQKRIIYGKVIDSLTNEPIDFANVRSNTNFSRTEQNGFYRIKLDSNDKKISFWFWGYQKKEFSLDSDISQLKLVSLSPTKFDEYFDSNTNPIDTQYFENKRIKQINFPHNGYKIYSITGKITEERCSKNARWFYNSGSIKKISVKWTSDSYIEINYYRNGKIKSEESYSFGHLRNKKFGEWIRSKQSKYFKRNGVPKKRLLTLPKCNAG